MPSGDENSKKRVNVAVFSADASKLTEKQITELKDKFGLSIRVRSDSAALDKMIGKIDEVSSYDRTHPGYDRAYDKDPDVGDELGAMINPSDLLRKPRRN